MPAVPGERHGSRVPPGRHVRRPPEAREQAQPVAVTGAEERQGASAPADDRNPRAGAVDGQVSSVEGPRDRTHHPAPGGHLEDREARAAGAVRHVERDQLTARPVAALPHDLLGGVPPIGTDLDVAVAERLSPGLGEPAVEVTCVEVEHSQVLAVDGDDRLVRARDPRAVEGAGVDVVVAQEARREREGAQQRGAGQRVVPLPVRLDREQGGQSPVGADAGPATVGQRLVERRARARVAVSRSAGPSGCGRRPTNPAARATTSSSADARPADWRSPVVLHLLGPGALLRAPAGSTARAPGSLQERNLHVGDVGAGLAGPIPRRRPAAAPR